MGVKEDYEILMKYRRDLITYGQRVARENPDKLNFDEIQALESRVFGELNKIDVSMGYPHHDTGVRVPKSIDKITQQALFIDFLDWYEIIPTPSNQIRDYVLKHYSPAQYHRVLCVGDGENVHLGRKLAQKGYNVISVDPVAKRSFTVKKGENGSKGSLHIIQGTFSRTSTDMIDWADLIVGGKVPQISEELVSLKKPTVFNISSNAEVHNMKFKGRSIKSSAELEEEILKCQGVRLEKGGHCNIYVFDQREQENGRD